MLDELAAALLRHIEGQDGASPYFTAVSGMAIMRSDQPKAPTHMIFRPALCIVAQGAKWATFGETKFEYGAGEALVVGVEAPSVGRVVEASPEKPCLVLAFELDLDIMRSVAEGMDERFPIDASAPRARGVLVTDFLGPLADCALRMVRLLDTPKAIPTLFPVIMREICYWLLTGPHGGDIARMALVNSPSRRVIEALHHLRQRFAEAVRVEELAALAGLSPSAFHRQFKALTSLSPVQYQKQIRLLEARRLMTSNAFNAEAAAFHVGYESPSQFSREYSRMFGEPPKRNLKRAVPGSLDGGIHDGEATLLRGAA